MGEPWQNKTLSSRNHTNESGMGCWGKNRQQSCHLLSFPSWKINNKMPRCFQSAHLDSDGMFCPLCTEGSPFTQFIQR